MDGCRDDDAGDQIRKPSAQSYLEGDWVSVRDETVELLMGDIVVVWVENREVANECSDRTVLFHLRGKNSSAVRSRGLVAHFAAWPTAPLYIGQLNLNQRNKTTDLPGTTDVQRADNKNIPLGTLKLCK